MNDPSLGANLQSGDDSALSIDFGTTSTVAAVKKSDGSVHVVEFQGERHVPSLVLVGDDGDLVAGPAASALASSRPARTVRSPKRRLSSETPAVLGAQSYPPSHLVAAVLDMVRESAVAYLGGPPGHVRLTHPAGWSPAVQHRLLEAASLAGLRGARLVSEPVAAALAFHHERPIPDGGHLAIYDLGGGTFDTTVVTATPQGFVLTADPAGDETIGGELFDEALVRHIGLRLDPDHWELLQSCGERPWEVAADRLRAEARRAKENLSHHTFAEVVVVTPAGTIDERITRDELESIVAPSLQRSIDLLVQNVKHSGLDTTELHAVHLVGGASRMPLVARSLEAALPGVPLSHRGDPRTAVAVGAALSTFSSLSSAPAPATVISDTALSELGEDEATSARSLPASEAGQLGPPAAPKAAVSVTDDTANGPASFHRALLAGGIAVLVALVALAAALGRDDSSAPGEALAATTTTPTFTTPDVSLPVASLPDTTAQDRSTPTTPDATGPRPSFPDGSFPDPLRFNSEPIPGGPTPGDAFTALLTEADLDSDWDGDTDVYSFDHYCGLGPVVDPVFGEGRVFTQMSEPFDHRIENWVLVFETEPEAILALTQTKQQVLTCPNGQQVVSGIEYTLDHTSGGPGLPTDQILVADELVDLPGDDYAVHIGTHSYPGFAFTRYHYQMRRGRTIVIISLMHRADELPATPSAELFSDFEFAVLDGFAAAAGVPR